MEKYRSEPFALLGVNSDDNREEVKRVIAEKNLNWRSWFAGGMEGDIPTRWRVRGWPTVVLIDARGVIRHIGHEMNRDTEAMIEELIAEAKAR